MNGFLFVLKPFLTIVVISYLKGLGFKLLQRKRPINIKPIKESPFIFCRCNTFEIIPLHVLNSIFFLFIFFREVLLQQYDLATRAVIIPILLTHNQRLIPNCEKYFYVAIYQCYFIELYVDNQFNNSTLVDQSTIFFEFPLCSNP